MQLQLPKVSLRYKKAEDKVKVFDVARKRWVSLTPEEFVRQHVIHYLNLQLNIPLSLIAVEKKVIINELAKRFDVVVFGSTQNIKLLVECKAPDIKINQNTLLQIANYNQHFNAEFLWLTNGVQHFYFRLNQDLYEQIDSLPEWPMNKN